MSATLIPIIIEQLDNPQQDTTNNKQQTQNKLQQKDKEESKILNDLSWESNMRSWN